MSVEVPDYLKKYVAETPAKQSDAEAMAAASMTVPRMSLRAKKFRWTNNGEELLAEAETHAVILGVDPPGGRFIKTYYEGQYTPGDTSPPTCSSSDGIRPDSWVTTPQNATCADCKHNIFGSAVSLKGKKSKKCRDAKRLWLVHPDKDKFEGAGVDGIVFGMNVPVTSLKNLSELGNAIKATGLPLSAAVVKLTMFDDESYPIVIFEIEGWLNEQYGPLAIGRNEARDWSGALKENNPPVLPDKLKTAALTTSAGAQAVQSAKVEEGVKSNADGSIEGTATSVPPKDNDVDAALKSWG